VDSRKKRVAKTKNSGKNTSLDDDTVLTTAKKHYLQKFIQQMVKLNVYHSEDFILTKMYFYLLL